MIDYKKVRAWDSGNVSYTYTARDTILYALGVGLGADPLNARELPFIYEKDLVAMPTMAAVLANAHGFWLRDQPELGVDWVKLVHGSESVRLAAPLPVAGTLIGRTRVTGVVDKGAGKGAVLFIEKKLTDEASGQLVATCERQIFCRGDGGFSATQGPGDEAPPAPLAVPSRPPELVQELTTRADQAALYRLSGDYNPLHIDPQIATQAGYPRPILHGLATYGVACRGLLQACCDMQPQRLAAMQARFASPVFPGETIRVEIWREGGEIAFQAKVVERDIVVLSHGRATVRG